MMQRGQKLPLVDAVGNGPVTFDVYCKSPSGTEADVSAFGLKADGKLLSDDWIIFYNQLAAPGIRKTENQHRFSVNTNDLPADIAKVVLAVTLDGPAVMSSCEVKVVIIAEISLEISLPVAEFPTEKALMLVEIYRHNGAWRLACVGQGFAGGLSAMLAYFGGSEASEAPAAPVAPAVAAPAPVVPVPVPVVQDPVAARKISLEKKVAEKAPALVSLLKTATVSLEKAKVDGVRARVMMVLDVSGSMNNHYRSGSVQKVVDRILPLALHFDDDGSLESYGYADRCKKLASVTLDTISGYVEKTDGGWGRWNIGCGNYEPAVMAEIIKSVKASKSKTPVYVIFITDGGIYEEAKITKLIQESSSLPIFWQFVGYGGSNYGVLHRLDKLSGRKVDNAGFFAVDGLHAITDAQLYDKLLSEFPAWLKAAKTAGIL